MTKSQMFSLAHKIAKKLNNSPTNPVGCYQIAFSLALKSLYSNPVLTSYAGSEIVFDGNTVYVKDYVFTLRNSKVNTSVTNYNSELVKTLELVDSKGKECTILISDKCNDTLNGRVELSSAKVAEIKRKESLRREMEKLQTEGYGY